MTPVLVAPRATQVAPSFKLRIAAGIVCRAAEALAADTPVVRDAARYLLMVERIRAVLKSSDTDRRGVLMASPAVIEGSGCSRTLIEMIECDPGDDAYRFKLAKILLRALIWVPESFPHPRD